MTPQRTFAPNARLPIDERQLAILVGMCVAACREVLTNATSVEAGTRQLVGDGHQGIGGIATDQTAEQAIRQFHTTGGKQISPEFSDPLATSQKLLLTVEEAAELLSIGRTLVYTLMMRRQIESIKVGRARRIPLAALQAFVTRARGIDVSAHATPQASMSKEGGEER